jgi:hypothetical protein
MSRASKLASTSMYSSTQSEASVGGASVGQAWAGQAWAGASMGGSKRGGGKRERSRRGRVKRISGGTSTGKMAPCPTHPRGRCSWAENGNGQMGTSVTVIVMGRGSTECMGGQIQERLAGKVAVDRSLAKRFTQNQKKQQPHQPGCRTQILKPGRGANLATWYTEWYRSKP